MITEKDYNIISEAIVHDLLRKRYKNKTIEKISGKGAGVFGDFKVGNKIIEVKGLSVDESGKDLDYDFVSSGFTLSNREWDFLKKYPNRFELWVVYRLDRKRWKNWKVKYAVIPGRILKTCTAEWYKVTIKIPSIKWKNTEQKNVPNHIWNKHKKRKSQQK